MIVHVLESTLLLAMAILIASESVIYGRFGYGVSSYLYDYEIDTHYGAYAEPFKPLGFDRSGVHPDHTDIVGRRSCT